MISANAKEHLTQWWDYGKDFTLTGSDYVNIK